jgi:hypothetical protein
MDEFPRAELAIGALDASALGGLGGLGGDEGVASAADEVASASGQEGGPDLEVVFRLEELEESPLQLPVAQLAGDVNAFTCDRINTCIIHTCRDIERGRDEVLDLIGAIAISLEEQRESDHGVQIAARV